MAQKIIFFLFVRKILVALAVGTHLFPFRTEQLSSPAPKILSKVLGKIGRRQNFAHKHNFKTIDTKSSSLNIPILKRKNKGFKQLICYKYRTKYKFT